MGNRSCRYIEKHPLKRNQSDNITNRPNLDNMVIDLCASMSDLITAVIGVGNLQLVTDDSRLFRSFDKNTTRAKDLNFPKLSLGCENEVIRDREETKIIDRKYNHRGYSFHGANSEVPQSHGCRSLAVLLAMVSPSHMAADH